MKTTEKPIETNRPLLCEDDRCLLPDEKLRTILLRTGMPVFLFDEKGLRACAKSLLRATTFDRLYVSASACPYPEILRILCEEGLGIVCRCPEELQTAITCGFPGARISYAGVCVRPELVEILRGLGAEMLLSSSVLFPDKLTDRVSILCKLPGRTAFPVPSTSRRPSAGLTPEEAMTVASMAKRCGASDLCLAAEPDTNCTTPGTAAQKAALLIRLAERIKNERGAEIGRIHLGVALGMEYHRGKPPVNAASELAAAEQILQEAPGNYRAECGVSRNLIEPNAIFAAACLGTYERMVPTILIDARFHQLAIPQLDRYRHISILGKYEVAGRRATDVFGIDPLAKDWFASARILPAAEEGDCLLLHDVGCCTTVDAECFLIRADGSPQRLSRGLDCFSATPDERSDPFPMFRETD